MEDTGIGIKEEDQSQLFKFFGKVGDDIDVINPTGIGLGLTICDKILNELGSSLSVNSQFGVGSTFTFILPLQHLAVDMNKNFLSYSL